MRRQFARKAALAAILLCVAFLAGHGWRDGKNDPATASVAAPSATPAPAPGKVLYVSPMNHIPPREQPGKCPVCGMELVPVPVEAVSDLEKGPSLRLSRATVEASGIRLAPVERRFVKAEVRLYGQIEYDPVHVSRVTAFAPGVINRIFVERVGQFVKASDILFEMFNQDLYNTQEEMQEALKYVPAWYAVQTGLGHMARNAPTQAPERSRTTPEEEKKAESAIQRLNAIHRKLHLLGLTKRDIDEMMQRGEVTGMVRAFSPRGGQVIEQQAFPGTFVNTGTTIFSIADPKFLWARFEAYEQDMPWVRVGMECEFTVDAYPGEIFTGKVLQVDPTIDRQTRTFKAGVMFPEPTRRLRPAMLARGLIRPELSAEGNVIVAYTPGEKPPLVIPETAPLVTGSRAVVYVAKPGDTWTFEAREVVLGPRARGWYLVKEGLTEGEQVVAAGNFKVDSAVQILARPSMMSLERRGTFPATPPVAPSEGATPTGWAPREGAAPGAAAPPAPARQGVAPAPRGTGARVPPPAPAAPRAGHGG